MSRVQKMWSHGFQRRISDWIFDDIHFFLLAFPALSVFANQSKAGFPPGFVPPEGRRWNRAHGPASPWTWKRAATRGPARKVPKSRNIGSGKRNKACSSRGKVLSRCKG